MTHGLTASPVVRGLPLRLSYTGRDSREIPMASKMSAGILLHRVRDGRREVLLVHPGGPFWARKDEGAWSIPKGEYDPVHEEPRSAALREFAEETGQTLQLGVEEPAESTMRPLGARRQAGGKTVHAWALAGDCDAEHIVSNRFAMEWPPRSGTMREFPEVDRAGWFTLPEARQKMLPAQAGFLDELEKMLK